MLHFPPPVGMIYRNVHFTIGFHDIADMPHLKPIINGNSSSSAAQNIPRTGPDHEQCESPFGNSNDVNLNFIHNTSLNLEDIVAQIKQRGIRNCSPKDPKEIINEFERGNFCINGGIMCRFICRPIAPKIGGLFLGFP